MSEAGGVVEYVTRDGDGNIIVGVDGHVNEHTINEINFKFNTPVDLTESLEKNNKKKEERGLVVSSVSTTKNGRTGYCKVEVKYPDGTTSPSIVIEDCIIQYTPAVDSEKSTYGKDFVNIAIPDYVIDKLINQAKTTESLTFQLKSAVKHVGPQYWGTYNLGSVLPGNCTIVSDTGESVNLTVEEALKDVKKSIRATVQFVISGSQKTERLQDPVPLSSGPFSISIKPTHIMLVEDTDIKGPEIKAFDTTKSTSFECSEASVARGLLASVVAKRLELRK